MPHSDIHGSKGARPSPRLFAACHVLHRLSVPRHPPNALRRLISAADKTAHASGRLVSSSIAAVQPAAIIAGTIQPYRAPAPTVSQPQTPTPDRTAPVTFLFTMSNTHADRHRRHPPQSRLSYSGPSVSALAAAHGAARLARRLFGLGAPARSVMVDGGRDRTDDLKLAKLALSQLSYAPVARSAATRPIEASGGLLRSGTPEAERPTVCPPELWWAREDLNLRPHAYQARALTN